MNKFKHRSKVGVAVAAILMTIGSVSPAFAANTVEENPIVIPPALGTNNFDVNSDGNSGFGSNLTLVNSSTNTFGVAGTPSNYNNLTNSSTNTIRSIGAETGNATNKNVLNNSNENTIDGRSNSLNNSTSNTIIGNANNLNYSNSSTITGNSNQLTGTSAFNSASNTITGDFNQLNVSASNTITGNSNVLENTHSSTITGNNVHITGGNFVAVVGNGAIVNGDNTTAMGNNSQVAANNSTAIGANSQASGTNSVALGAGSIADRDNTVSVGNRQITNVANGTMSNDAVNVGQWMAGNAITEGKIYRSGALAAALTGIMPLAYDPNARTQIGVGVGGYHGEKAVAFGVNHYVNESLLVNAGMSVDGSDRMYRGGLTWRLGHTTPKLNTVEVENMRSQIQQQDSELQLLKQQVAALVAGQNQTTVVAQSPVQKIVIQDVLFDFDKDTLQQQAYPILDNVVTVVKNNPSGTYVLVGHTDSKGLKAYNMDLSLRRAKTVQNYLISQGVPANLLSIAKDGELQPKGTNATAEGRAENRRVEIYVK